VAFKVQIPHGVRYSVSCSSCEYRERLAEGIRYLDFRVSSEDRVVVDFPEPPTGGERVRLNARVHALLASMENPHPEWVRRPTLRRPAEDPFTKAEVWIKLKITKGGVYEITYDMLRSMGVEPTLYSVGSFKMLAMLDTFPTPVDSATVWGREVAIWVDTAGRRILFWGEPMRSYRVKDTTLMFFQHPYTDTTTYFLGLGGAPGRRITVGRFTAGEPAVPISVFRHEEELVNLGKKGRVWLGEEMLRLATDPDRTFPFTFTLDDLDEDAGAVLLRTGIATSEFSDTAAVVLRVNEYPCDSVILLPAKYAQMSCVPTVIRGENSLTFTIKAIATSQTVYLDYYEILYHSTGTYSNEGIFYVKADGRFSLRLRGNRPVFVWDVSDPYSPVILESYSYGEGILILNDSARTPGGWAKLYVANFARRPVSVQLFTPKNLRGARADYVALGHSSFASTYSSFLRYRESHMPRFDGNRWYVGEGTTLWVNLEDIYDEFGLGNPDPTAIRNFLYNMNLISGGEQPLYVTLVGDGTYDYRGKTPGYFPEGVPPYYPRDLSLSINNDNMGAADDYYANFDYDDYSNVGLGRIPVRTVEELQEYLDKVKDYEALKHDGLWRLKVMLVADDEAGSYYCETMHTYQVLYRVGPVIPKWMIMRPFLLQKYPFEGMTKPTASRDLKRFINEGALMISFFAHGNPTQLTHEQILGLDDMPEINTQGREPFITVLSCKVGAYDRLDPIHVLGEELMIRRNRAIAVLSATALSLANSNATYAATIYRYLRTYGKTPLGYLSLQGKYLAYYVLLGEPAVMLALPDSTGEIWADTPTRGTTNLAVGGGPGYFAVADLPDRDTVSFSCNVTYEYYDVRPVIYEGMVPKDSVRFWIPLRGRLSSPSDYRDVSIPRDEIAMKAEDYGTPTPSASTRIPIYSPEESILLLWWNGWEMRTSRRILLKVNPTLGEDKPRVKGYYAGDELSDGFRLPTTATLTFKFYSREGFDIRTSGRYSSPPRIILDNSISDVLQVEIVNDTTAKASYTVDYSSDPGIHNVAVSITSALGIRGYSLWDLAFVESTVSLKDILAYPNPYRSGPLYLTFKLSQSAHVSVRLYTTTGKIISSYDLGELSAGFNSTTLELPPLANGLYVLVVDARSEVGASKGFTRLLILR